MALTYSNQKTIYRGHYQIFYVDATFDSSYASGGESVAASDFGLAQILHIECGSKEGWIVRYVKSDETSGTLKAYASLTPDTSSAVAAPLQSSTGRDLSSVTASLIIYGR